MAKGKKFNLNDMKEQLEQMQNMGGINSLMDKLPGMGQIPDHLKQQVTGKEVPRMIAIINSMTQKERRNPALLNGSRRVRIAKGSGLQPSDVNKLMKQYQQMEKNDVKTFWWWYERIDAGNDGCHGWSWKATVSLMKPC